MVAPQRRQPCWNLIIDNTLHWYAWEGLTDGGDGYVWMIRSVGTHAQARQWEARTIVQCFVRRLW
eukprot:5310699-Pyramimonas_sp.AAC.1